MSDPLLQQALAHLEATKSRWPEVARGSGVPYSTITKIFQRVIRDPRVSTVQRLLDHRDGRSIPAYPDTDSAGSTISEIQPPAGAHLTL
jgi:predicted transcriptional regulator